MALSAHAPPSAEPTGPRSYATFGVTRSARQAWHALTSRGDASRRVEVLLARLRRDEARMHRRLGTPLRGLRVLEVGGGQHLSRARALGLHNQVEVLDLDLVADRLTPATLVAMLRRNGAGRVVKTLGRRLLGVDRAEARAWRRALGTERLPTPELIQGDICRDPPREGAYDLVCSWSTLEHLRRPEAGVRNMIRALRPGGVLYAGIHLYTCNSGHHDIRAFTGQALELPPWGHLRLSTRHLLQPSAYLNGWRLAAWRDLFAELAPGATEYSERYGEDTLRARLTPELRAELADYSDDELFTVDLFFLWKRPKISPRGG